MYRIFGRFGEIKWIHLDFVMRINHLTLKNYRNYDFLDIDLSPGVNIFVGDNAQGKSNILESIFVLALTKSYINIKDQNLMKDGSDFSVVRGLCSSKDGNFQLDVLFGKCEKKVKHNSFEVKKYSEYISILKVLIFSPYNVNFVKDGPNSRRKAINVVISQSSEMYVRALQKYNALLKKRNQYLKNAALSFDYNKYYFDILNDSYCSLAVDIAFMRNEFLKKINQYLSDVYFEITGYKNLKLMYICNFKIKEDKVQTIRDFKNLLIDNFDREKKYKITLFGIHRDDFCFLLDGKDLSIYGSQGQIRAAMLALKLAEVLIFKELDGDNPILLLDDVFSELDVEKRNRIIKYILNDVQTIITTTDIDLIDSDLVSKSKIFNVCNGTVVTDGKKVCKNE